MSQREISFNNNKKVFSHHHRTYTEQNESVLSSQRNILDYLKTQNNSKRNSKDSDTSISPLDVIYDKKSPQKKKLMQEIQQSYSSDKSIRLPAINSNNNSQQNIILSKWGEDDGDIYVKNNMSLHLNDQKKSRTRRSNKKFKQQYDLGQNDSINNQSQQSIQENRKTSILYSSVDSQNTDISQFNNNNNKTNLSNNITNLNINNIKNNNNQTKRNSIFYSERNITMPTNYNSNSDIMKKLGQLYVNDNNNTNNNNNEIYYNNNINQPRSEQSIQINRKQNIIQRNFQSKHDLQQQQLQLQQNHHNTISDSTLIERMDKRNEQMMQKNQSSILLNNENSKKINKQIDFLQNENNNGYNNSIRLRKKHNSQITKIHDDINSDRKNSISSVKSLDSQFVQIKSCLKNSNANSPLSDKNNLISKIRNKSVNKKSVFFGDKNIVYDPKSGSEKIIRMVQINDGDQKSQAQLKKSFYGKQIFQKLKE